MRELLEKPYGPGWFWSLLINCLFNLPCNNGERRENTGESWIKFCFWSKLHLTKSLEVKGTFCDQAKTVGDLAFREDNGLDGQRNDGRGSLGINAEVVSWWLEESSIWAMPGVSG